MVIFSRSFNFNINALYSKFFSHIGRDKYVHTRTTCSKCNYFNITSDRSKKGDHMNQTEDTKYRVLGKKAKVYLDVLILMHLAKME